MKYLEMGRPLNVRLSSSSTSFLLIMVVVMVAAAAGGSSRPPEVPCYFIFGDSLFDSGNNNNLDTLTKANYAPYGVGFPAAGPTGRFTDGRTIADILGEVMGFESFIPPFAANPNRSELLVGVNYASASAGILVKSGKQGGDNVDMSKQLRNHATIVSSIVSILGSKESAYRHLAKCLYISDMGNNDYINNYFLRQSSNTRKMYDPEQYATLLIEKYSRQIKRMYKLGARKVGLVGVSPVGCTPAAIATGGGRKNGSLCVESMNKLVTPFNARLVSLIDRLNVDFPDAKFVYLNSTLANQLAIQAFKVKTAPCCKVSSVTGLCIMNSATCKARRSYFFWDAFHPTECSNRIVAYFFYQAIKPIL